MQLVKDVIKPAYSRDDRAWQIAQ